MHKTLLAALSALLLGLTAAAEDKKDDKIDPAKLVGKWTPKEKRDNPFVVEFTKDGKAKFTGTVDGKEMKSEGTYKADGNKVRLTMSLGEKVETTVRTVTKLTDDELISRDEKGETDTLVRVKDKK
jgi:uncharacterized protein (TIGR03066 family)